MLPPQTLICRVSGRPSACASVRSRLYLRSACRYFNETGHTLSLARTDDTDNIEKVTGSKVKVNQWRRSVVPGPLEGF